VTVSSPLRICMRFVLVTVVLGLFAGCSRAGREESTTSRAAVPSAAPPAEDSTPIRRVVDAQIARFALLRSPPEGLPDRVRRVLRQPSYGMNWSFAQRVPGAPGGTYWLVPGRDTLCLLHARDRHQITSACAPTDVALKHGVVSASLQSGNPPRRLVVGILPSDVQRVTVRTGAVTTTAPVTRGLLILRDARQAPPDEITPVGRT
jgi:hypothetical protein